jgi:hypothetical protein
MEIFRCGRVVFSVPRENSISRAGGFQSMTERLRRNAGCDVPD